MHSCSDGVWRKKQRANIVKVKELGRRQDGTVTTGGPYSDCKVKLAYREEEGHQSRRTAPPPRWTDPTPVKAALSIARKMEVEQKERETNWNSYRRNI